MRKMNHIAVVLNMCVLGIFCCSDFKDKGIGWVAKDFGDAIMTTTASNQIHCAKQCDASATCTSFEYGAEGPGVGVNCTLRDLPIAMDHFYTTRSNHRYYYKDAPEMRHIGCYLKGTRAGDTELKNMDVFMQTTSNLDQREVMQHLLNLCASYAHTRGYRIFFVQDFTNCRVWNDSPEASTAFQGFIPLDDGCHQQGFVSLVGDNDHMSVFEILG